MVVLFGEGRNCHISSVLLSVWWEGTCSVDVQSRVVKRKRAREENPCTRPDQKPQASCQGRQKISSSSALLALPQERSSGIVQLAPLFPPERNPEGGRQQWGRDTYTRTRDTDVGQKRQCKEAEVQRYRDESH